MVFMDIFLCRINKGSSSCLHFNKIAGGEFVSFSVANLPRKLRTGASLTFYQLNNCTSVVEQVHCISLDFFFICNYNVFIPPVHRGEKNKTKTSAR